MTLPKATHRAVAGHVRLTLYQSGGRGSQGTNSITFERRRDPSGEGWYPAASFPCQELSEIEQTTRELREQMTSENKNPPGKGVPADPPTGGPASISAKGNAQGRPEDDLDEPPFQPNPPPETPPSKPDRTRRTDRSTSPKPTRTAKPKSVVKASHSKAKARSR